jgi:hypothetical protein
MADIQSPEIEAPELESTVVEPARAIQLLAPAEAAAAVRAIGARGFFDLDPVTQNDALMARELTTRDVQVYRVGDTLLASAVNPVQPRQAYVASTSGDPEPVRALLAFLRAYLRCTSYLALVPAGAAAADAFTGCGFEQVGVLREHRYQTARYHDVYVLAKGA